MLTAIDEKNKLVNLLESSPEELTGQYFCPACKTEVVLKNGNIKITHFAHKTLQNCESWTENESVQHLTLKKILYRWFKKSEKVEVEKYLPELKQTPDLLVNDKIAIEVQCSSLSLKRLKERTENYQTHGYSVIWLMGKKLWLSHQLTELQKNLMYFSENRGFYFWELDLERKKLRLKSLIHQDLRGNILHLTEEILFGHGELLTHLRQPFSAQAPLSLPVSADRGLFHFVRQQLFHRSTKWLEIQEKYYQQGKNLLTENFDKPYIAPPGLNLLSVSDDKISSANFTQITQNLVPYYQNFLENFKKNPRNKLYPPRFYAIIKEVNNETKAK
ncbi:competence protein CoiA [Lactococcus allomyrinae]|uniref:Competence protein CoiA n=1 Tax=Lactococcus allomyrinae TaxID=2419773 RepID=A0A387BIN8_9LACT|nr:competence protein CoiA family protein [Lactococcus allomyrinae]AYG00760.1 competence protein CoiA [Lactococcus allomyrinae]